MSAEEPNRIMVYLRIRPAKKGEIDPAAGTTKLLDIQPDNKSCTLESKTYSYDWIFDGDNVEQELIFSKVAEPVIGYVFKGFWGTVMVYGQTGTGKSFTMCNFHPTNEGIIPRTMRAVFTRIDSEPDRVYTVCFSFIQIYLDKLQDLFNPEDRNELKINRDEKGVSFPGITEHIVKDADDFKRLYEEGNHYRVVTATKMNPESSRGHAALFIQIKSVPKDDPGGEVRNGKLFLIDLAGYERFSKTGVQEGLMAQEAKTINGSLLALGNCVSALSDKSEHVPWRNAKLTRMLEDAIGGRAKCSIILTAGPSSEHMHETLGTLYFGSRAMAVKTNAKVAVNIDYKKLAAKLQDMLSQAEGRINALEVEATRRQLEREESEARFQAESARVKRRQEEQLQDLLQKGATKEKIQELINFNQQEQELLEEQHYQERTMMEERHEDEVKIAIEKQASEMTSKTEASTTNMTRDISELQRQLAYERQEKEKFKAKSKEAEQEARRSLVELNETKMKLEGSTLGASVVMDPKEAASAKYNPEIRKEFDRRVESVRSMLEENFALKLAEVEEPLREELDRYKKLYDDLKRKADGDLQVQKDTITSAYESEIAELKRASVEVQEKLKKNHLTIKKSYQDQKDRLADENEDQFVYITQLQKQIESLGAAPVKQIERTKPRPSMDDDDFGADLGGGSSDKIVQELLQKMKDMKTEMAYVVAEKEALVKQNASNNAVTGSGEERMNPAQIRKIKSENEELKQQKTQVETELLKLKAAQALTGPLAVVQDDDDEADEDRNEDLFGDTEGIRPFVEKVLKYPFFVGAQPIQNSHDKIAQTLTTDLDEYRRTLKYRFVFIGEPSVGKSSVIKCLSAASVPLIRSPPEVVTPTVHPLLTATMVDDSFVSKTDWYKLYVQFQDVETKIQQTSFIGGSLSALGLAEKKTGVADPAKVHVELLDMPGEPTFWRGMPSSLLPSKNAVYCITYDVSQTIEETKVALERQLSILHASCNRNYAKKLGGDAPRVAFCLIGTRKDAMRDSREAAVLAHLNKVTICLGDVFFKLRGEDTYGLVCVGSFAVSARDWSVVSTKGDRGPRSFKELLAMLGGVATQLFPNHPTSFLLSSKDTASHMTYMLGDDLMEAAVEKTSHLLPAQQRLRKGMITLLTSIAREQKVRWVMDEADLRTLAAEHLGVDPKSSYGIQLINYILRELLVRGVVVAVPQVVMEPKYLPKPPEDISPDETPLPRAGLIVLDPNRLLMIYSLFRCPSSLVKVQPTASFFKERSIMLFDTLGLPKLAASNWQRGVLTQELGAVVYAKILAFTCNDIKLMFELYCVMGFGLSLRSEVAMIAPSHFGAPISGLLTEYIPYLLANHGDGIGRKYKMNCLPAAFFARLQTKLMPFSHAPSKDAQYIQLNWSNASFLVLEKTRLKWGIFGSKVVKDAVMSAASPIRGFLKMEGDYLYCALTSRSGNPQQMAQACKGVLDAIHYEVTSLCKREFRGVRPQFQDLIITGYVVKRQRLADGIRSIVTKFGASPDEVTKQLQLIGNLADPKGGEIEAAITALPSDLKDDQ